MTTRPIPLAFGTATYTIRLRDHALVGLPQPYHPAAMPAALVADPAIAGCYRDPPRIVALPINTEKI